MYPVAPHPTNTNGVICFDLRADPAQLLDLPVDEIRLRLFTPAAQLPDGQERIPLKTIHVNRAPVLAPLKTLTAQTAERWRIDPHQVAERAQWIAASAAEIQRRVQDAHQMPETPAETDPDRMLYSGGFFSDADRRAMDAVHRLAPNELAGHAPTFEDPRLPRMLFRYRARNWPETLTPDERADWDEDRFARLTDPAAGGGIQIDQYEQRLLELTEAHADDPARLQILESLSDWAERIFDAGLFQS